MPQMAPMNWTSMYVLFSMLFLLTMIMNYFVFLYSTDNETHQKKTKSHHQTWKW
uniref:ATP synthase complex subunit 8 n=1 Tax=Scolytinae sp. BMNH 1039994 TaxID=1903773 RepID=A0A343A5U0_9CUCU|nr:ATP synthase F0 subunit 8 [Scolytinae sp. BMNH 1039994]